MSNNSRLAAVQVAAILFIALTLVPGGAHLFALLNKMKLAPEQYMIAQRAYDGWALFAIAIAGALILTLWHSYLQRRHNVAMLLSLVAFLCLVAGQVIFWVYTYPMNVASSQWTSIPADFEAARWQWEYSHAADALLSFLALLAFTMSLVAGRRESTADVAYDRRPASVSGPGA